MRKFGIALVVSTALSACAAQAPNDLADAIALCERVWDDDITAPTQRACSQVIAQSAVDLERAEAYNARGVIHRRKGRLDEAVADFNEAIQLNPTSSSTHSNRGIAYAQMGKGDLAMASFSKAIELNPKNATAYNNYSWFLSKRGDYEDALAMADKALENNFRHQEYHDTKAHALMGLGRQEDAEEAFDIAASFGGADLVKAYQKTLIAKGYDPGRSDGEFDERTKEALAACIRDNCRLMLD